MVAYPRELPGRKALTYQLILRIPAISIFFSAKGWSWYPYLGQPPSIEINAFRVLTLVVLHGPACRRPCKAGQGGCAGAMPCTLDRTRTVEKMDGEGSSGWASTWRIMFQSRVPAAGRPLRVGPPFALARFPPAFPAADLHGARVNHKPVAKHVVHRGLASHGALTSRIALVHLLTSPDLAFEEPLAATVCKLLIPRLRNGHQETSINRCFMNAGPVRRQVQGAASPRQEVPERCGS